VALLLTSERSDSRRLRRSVLFDALAAELGRQAEHKKISEEQ
jgi:hypothetical protein